MECRASNNRSRRAAHHQGSRRHHACPGRHMRPADFLYGLLPAIYREQDLSLGTPLRALFAILQQQYDLLEDDIGALYDNWFVETCEPWVLPYLAELLGATEVTR